MIHQFTKKEFEEALPRRSSAGELLWKQSGTNGNEYCYEIFFDDKDSVRILVRSTINPLTGKADAAGNDSIRCFLVNSSGEILLSKRANLKRWVTRQPGWEKRMYTVFSYLRTLRQKSGNCPVCNRPLHINTVANKSSTNYGRIYAVCSAKKHYKESFKFIKRVT